jgi:adenine-specific DNA-methyltransferase
MDDSTLDRLASTSDRRIGDLRATGEALRREVVFRGERSLVAHGDATAMLPQIPDSSVSLILTDPPYHSTKKGNIFGDRAFAKDEEYLHWMRTLAPEWRRVLRRNGGLYVFCSAPMAARLEVALSEFFRPLSHITWTKPNEPGFDGWKGKMNKEALRTWYPHSERVLFFEHAGEGNERRSALGDFLRQQRVAAGVSQWELTEQIGAYGRVNHGGAVSNWEAGRNVPSREQYARIRVVLESTGLIAPMPHFEDVVRPFHMAGHLQYTDIWDFPSVRPYFGKHPGEKPVELLRHAIEATTYEGDVVLDCFAGSGATGVAALMANRRPVLLEIEEKWVRRTAQRVCEAEELAPHQTLVGARKKRAGSQRSTEEAEEAGTLF